MKVDHPLFGVYIDTDDLAISKILFGLDNIYKSVPETKCLHCPEKEIVDADCCKTFSPPLYLSEFLSVIKKIEKESNLKDIVLRCIDSFLFVDESMLKKPCPLLENNICVCYEQRPFSCRNFGLYSELEWEKRLEKIVNENEIKKEDVPFYEQCKFVKTKGKNKKIFSKEMSDKSFNEIYRLDVEILKNQRTIGNVTYMPFDHHLLVLFLGPNNLDQLTDMKILLINAMKKKQNKEISEEEFNSIKNNINEFSKMVKDSV